NTGSLELTDHRYGNLPKGFGGVGRSDGMAMQDDDVFLDGVGLPMPGTPI
ncbi:hypothetical protein ASPFODRAFT_55094, partial [Aspergillus luchuensis CBS 106.47]